MTETLRRDEKLRLTIETSTGAWALHEVAEDERGIPKHQTFTAPDRHGITLLLKRQVERWIRGGGKYE